MLHYVITIVIVWNIRVKVNSQILYGFTFSNHVITPKSLSKSIHNVLNVEGTQCTLLRTRMPQVFDIVCTKFEIMVLLLLFNVVFMSWLQWYFAWSTVCRCVLRHGCRTYSQWPSCVQSSSFSSGALSTLPEVGKARWCHIIFLLIARGFFFLQYFY